MEDSVKLTNTQRRLLAAASQRPSQLTGGSAGKVVAKLLAEGLVEDRPFIELHFTNVAALGWEGGRWRQVWPWVSAITATWARCSASPARWIAASSRHGSPRGLRHEGLALQAFRPPSDRRLTDQPWRAPGPGCCRLPAPIRSSPRGSTCTQTVFSELLFCLRVGGLEHAFPFNEIIEKAGRTSGGNLDQIDLLERAALEMTPVNKPIDLQQRINFGFVSD
jgi:hypothetical protein